MGQKQRKHPQPPYTAEPDAYLSERGRNRGLTGMRQRLSDWIKPTNRDNSMRSSVPNLSQTHDYAVVVPEPPAGRPPSSEHRKKRITIDGEIFEKVGCPQSRASFIQALPNTAEPLSPQPHQISVRKDAQSARTEPSYLHMRSQRSRGAAPDHDSGKHPVMNPDSRKNTRKSHGGYENVTIATTPASNSPTPTLPPKQLNHSNSSGAIPERPGRKCESVAELQYWQLGTVQPDSICDQNISTEQALDCSLDMSLSPCLQTIESGMALTAIEREDDISKTFKKDILRDEPDVQELADTLPKMSHERQGALKNPNSQLYICETNVRDGRISLTISAEEPILFPFKGTVGEFCVRVKEESGYDCYIMEKTDKGGLKYCNSFELSELKFPLIIEVNGMRNLVTGN